MKQIIYAALLMMVTIGTSCSKTTSEVKVESKLVGKWILKKSVDITTGNNPQTHTDYFQPNEYIQFESPNKCTVRVDGKIYTTVWELLEDGKVLFIHPTGDLDVPDDGYTIDTLTDNSLVLRWKEGNYEVFIYLEK